MRRWWSQKYQRPPNDPLFTGQTIAELQLEMFEDMLLQRESLEDHLDHLADAESRREAREKIQALNEILGDTKAVEDPLIEKWEEELARGQVPDLTER